MDMVTKCNYTPHIIEHIIHIHGLVKNVLSYYKFTPGNKEFKSNKTKLANILDERWALLEGLSYLLTLFDRETIILSGDN